MEIENYLNKVIKGDCLDIMPNIPSKSIDMILCDLPYGTTQNKWDSVIDLEKLWTEYERIIKDNGAIILTSQGIFTAKLILSNEKLFKYKMTWIKSKPTNFLNAKKQPLRKHEDICIFYKNQPTYNPQMTKGEAYDKGIRKDQYTGSYGDFKPRHVKSNGDRYPNDVLFYEEQIIDDFVYVKTAESEGTVYHPTQKPIELGRYLIKTFTNKGDIILDNACGSGSFLLSAILEDRKFIGIEKNENVLLHKVKPIDYIKICEERIEENIKKKEFEKMTLFTLREPIVEYGKLNERTWAGQIISWINQSISKGTTIFQYATNDEGIKVASGKTKFPDILLFIDKISGIIFNGWELKFPDTKADDIKMLENAIEKAERLKSNSFVTWNGTEAIIWRIRNNDYSVSGLEKLKIYPKENDITNRNDLADRNNYQKHEAKLQKRLDEILCDLGQLYISGTLKKAVNISSNIVEAVSQTAKYFTPQFKNKINELKNYDKIFRNEFNQWKIIESATLKILSKSSRRVENIDPEEILAKFTFYKFIGKILFYLTLSENLSGKIPDLKLKNKENIQTQLNTFFNKAKKIDYQAVFENDFTDKIPFNNIINDLLFELVHIFNEFDFKILPTEVIGHILENLVPQEEKQKFGQYFTSETLANLVTFSAIKSKNDVLIDPTSGTGTFLNSFYLALVFLGNKNHQEILNQIWGNDISHFPATLSVINLYKQKVDDIANFPRVIRKDFFKILPTQTIAIPDNIDIDKINQVPIPKFDAVISNFPFIQHEDIPNEELSSQFKDEFTKTQNAFLNGNKFEINGKSDYYIYCFYNSLKFLKNNGMLSAITSNAWLGKNYGLQFKMFLLDNFHIKYIVRSNAEHWFKDSKVSTIFITLEKGVNEKHTKFITINEKLHTLFKDKSMQQFEDFYVEVDNCNYSQNLNWKEDIQFKNVFHKKDGTTSVSIVEYSTLVNSLTSQENWTTYFVSQDVLNIFEDKLINPFPDIYDVGRGTRTGCDDMYIISNTSNKFLKIEKKFLLPILRTSQELETIIYNNKNKYNFFVCTENRKKLKEKYPNAYKHIKKFEITTNKTGVVLPEILKARKPFWYSLKPEDAANIFISINPDKRLFFSYSKIPIYLNQRLVAIRIEKKDVEIVTALLNSIVSLLIVELNGVSRNLGALDLNADFFKTKMKIFNPYLLTNKQKDNILSKFEPLSKRKIQDYENEYKQKDRIDFDKEVLKAYGFKVDILPQLYLLLTETIHNRVNMKNR